MERQEIQNRFKYRESGKIMTGVLGALIYGVLSAVVDVYLTPYLNLSTCRFYQLATAPQVNEPPHFDSWNDNF